MSDLPNDRPNDPTAARPKNRSDAPVAGEQPPSGAGETRPGESRDSAEARDDREAPADEAPSEPTGAGEAAPPAPTPVTQQIGRVVIVLLAVLFGIFAVANSQRVDFSWVFGETLALPGGGGVPLIVLLVLSFIIGAAIGVLFEWQLIRARKRRRQEQNG